MVPVWIATKTAPMVRRAENSWAGSSGNRTSAVSRSSDRPLDDNTNRRGAEEIQTRVTSTNATKTRR